MDDDTTDSWSLYVLPARECELRHPPDWTVVSGMFGSLVAVIAPPRGSDAFRTNLNIVLQPADEAMSQEECVATQLIALETALADVIVLESEATVFGERAGARAVAAHRDGDHELTLEQWMAPVEAGTLVLSATALTSDFPHDAETLRAIADSVRLDG
ncbi:MAG: hypothetical protein QOG15_663 [Solirubrobacteraceae bacterium]|jgi:hypothetical protein|nr:hypothetical protein [Solirubrobacteraceae bacterium]